MVCLWQVPSLPLHLLRFLSWLLKALLKAAEASPGWDAALVGTQLGVVVGRRRGKNERERRSIGGGLGVSQADPRRTSRRHGSGVDGAWSPLSCSGQKISRSPWPEMLLGGGGGELRGLAGVGGWWVLAAGGRGSVWNLPPLPSCWHLRLVSSSGFSVLSPRRLYV